MSPAPEDWRGYLADFHAERSGITEDLLAGLRRRRRRPYGWLAEAVPPGARVLDLACGSAPTGELRGAAQYVGLDLSAARGGRSSSRDRRRHAEGPGRARRPRRRGDGMLAETYAIVRSMTMEGIAGTWAPYLTMSETLRSCTGQFRSDSRRAAAHSARDRPCRSWLALLALPVMRCAGADRRRRAGPTGAGPQLTPLRQNCDPDRCRVQPTAGCPGERTAGERRYGRT